MPALAREWYIVPSIIKLKVYVVDKFSDRTVISSWVKNAQPWVAAIRGGKIESRELVTNKAIVETVLDRNPGAVLDLGCGEGWLVRELAKSGVDCLGVDAVPELIDCAKNRGGGAFKVVAYEDISNDAIKEKFDVIVCNFSLLGEESVDQIFQHAPLLLNKGGWLIVQTIHPLIGSQEDKYKDGWREESWADFGNDFTEPAPWYFRTLETWKTLFSGNDFVLDKIIEPLNPITKQPASIIISGRSSV